MKSSAAAFLCVCLAWAGVAKADIISWTCANDGDGAINCQTTGWHHDTSAGEYDLTIAGDQFWGPGHMLMNFGTDTGADPTIKSINEITNDTGSAWTGYQVNVTLDTNTALTSYALSNAVVTAPGNWTATVTQGLTYEGRVGSKYEYVGTIDFAGGAPVADGGELDFSYKMSFAGATSYSAIQSITPTPVPEPATLSLLALGLGGLGLLRKRRNG